MASEELEQRYPDGKGQKLGDLEVFECDLTQKDCYPGEEKMVE